MSDSAKVVQTELEKDEYDSLVRVAEKEGKTLKQLLREAVNEYAQRHEEIDFDDPFFEVKTDEASGEEKTANKTDEYLYGKDG
ncbi:MAG: hypothetical protein U5J64_12605 [Halobacteriales archaeon]|nr:hypothetical protein [Halobacteriales archaeon]